MRPIYDHLILNNDFVNTQQFTSPQSPSIRRNIPDRDRYTHAVSLQHKLLDIWESDVRNKVARKAISLPTRDGTYLEFLSKKGYELITDSLENRRRNIQLLNVKQVVSEEGNLTKATVFIPKGSEKYFLDKVKEYAEKETKKGNPRNAPLINSIEDIKLALLESFWRPSEIRLIPQEIKTWCEVWVRIPEIITDNSSNFEIVNRQLDSFRELLNRNEIECKSNSILFPERAILLIRVNRVDLIELINQSDEIAEFRVAQEVATIWTGDSNVDQTDWVEDLKTRLSIEESNIKVCLLDSGVNNGHLLLRDILSDSDCLTVDPSWGTDDRSEIAPKGHGTLMAGLGGYGNLQKALEVKEAVHLTHKLCSVKILPNKGESPIEVWGDFTQQAAYRAEKVNPNHKILYCMAVTSADDVDVGRPSSWSGAMDQMCFGVQNQKRLMLISAGNYSDEGPMNFPECNKNKSVQNPAQSWNALTIGAYTEKVQVNDPRLSRFQRVAQPGEISPFTTTSAMWEKRSPIKPEVLMEGGNALIRDQVVEANEDLELLTTSKIFTFRQFDTISGTSAAAAQAAWLAAKIAYRYPDIWPESIRGLIVHSAAWTKEMKSQFHNIKSDLIRCCGYGVPDIQRALNSYENGFTFIAQERIQPFVKYKSECKTNDMHLYDLPWPTELLMSLANTPVKLKITLSYFVEPSPGEIGWNNKYRYQSHGLRFDIKRTGESPVEFQKRINRTARDSGEEFENTSDPFKWQIGPNSRNVGSIHSDTIETTAAEITDCNLIAVYPVTGWWKTRTHLKKINQRTRYSLLVSLETPNEEIPLYSTVKNMIGVPVEIKV